MDEQLQAILVQLEQGKQQMEQLNRQGQMLESAIAEVDETVSALETINSQESDTPALVPIGAGSYVNAKVTENEHVLVGIGAGFSVEKKVPDAVSALRERRTQMEQSHRSLQKIVGEIAQRLAELNGQAQSMMAQTQRPQ